MLIFAVSSIVWPLMLWFIKLILDHGMIGRGSKTRTCGPRAPNAMLSQLSYTPIMHGHFELGTEATQVLDRASVHSIRPRTY